MLVALGNGVGAFQLAVYKGSDEARGGSSANRLGSAMTRSSKQREANLLSAQIARNPGWGWQWSGASWRRSAPWRKPDSPSRVMNVSRMLWRTKCRTREALTSTMKPFGFDVHWRPKLKFGHGEARQSMQGHPRMPLLTCPHPRLVRATNISRARPRAI